MVTDRTLIQCIYCNEHVPFPCEKRDEIPWCGRYWWKHEADDSAVVNDKTSSDGGSTDYYKIPDGATDLIDLIEHKDMGFSLGNIFKACYRLGEKQGVDAVYDLNKIIFFAERMKRQVQNN